MHVSLPQVGVIFRKKCRSQRTRAGGDVRDAHQHRRRPAGSGTQQRLQRLEVDVALWGLGDHLDGHAHAPGGEH